MAWGFDYKDFDVRELYFGPHSPWAAWVRNLRAGILTQRREGTPVLFLKVAADVRRLKFVAWPKGIFS
jgi:hypothetical protein